MRRGMNVSRKNCVISRENVEIQSKFSKLIKSDDLCLKHLPWAQMCLLASINNFFS